MTFQEAHKNGKNGLVARRNLTQDELINRLTYYYDMSKANDIIRAVCLTDCWTDGDVVITSTYKNDCVSFIAIANGNYMKLIEP